MVFGRFGVRLDLGAEPAPFETCGILGPRHAAFLEMQAPILGMVAGILLPEAPHIEALRKRGDCILEQFLNWLRCLVGRVGGRPCGGEARGRITFSWYPLVP